MNTSLLYAQSLEFSSFKAASAYLQDNYSPSGLAWFEEYEVINSSESIYQNLTKALDGHVIIGGSDLVDLIVGDGFKISKSETNIIHPLDQRLEGLNQFEEIFLAPTRQTPDQQNKKSIQYLKTYIPSIDPLHALSNLRSTLTIITKHDLKTGTPYRINFQELHQEWKLYQKNYQNGHSAAYNNKTELWLALKSQYLIIISPDNEFRVYFRDSKAKSDFKNKILRLPDEDRLQSNPFDKLTTKHDMVYALSYNLMILSKAKKTGWRFSKQSEQYLKKLAIRVMQNPDYSSDFQKFFSVIWSQAEHQHIIEVMQDFKIPYNQKCLEGFL